MKNLRLLATLRVRGFFWRFPICFPVSASLQGNLVFRFDGKPKIVCAILRFYATIPPYQTTSGLR
jgi:hypothetical protein